MSTEKRVIRFEANGPKGTELQSGPWALSCAPQLLMQ